MMKRAKEYAKAHMKERKTLMRDFIHGGKLDGKNILFLISFLSVFSLLPFFALNLTIPYTFHIFSRWKHIAEFRITNNDYIDVV